MIQQNEKSTQKKLCIENKVIDLQLSLFSQFEMCTGLEEQVKVCKNYETKKDHYTRQLHYCNMSMFPYTTHVYRHLCKRQVIQEL